jgi:hypothetical protein
MAHEVFICYANQDEKTAHEIYHTLKANDITCWMAPDDIIAGEDWDKAIMDAIPLCRIVVLVFSANSNDSPYCVSEIRTAFDLKKEILPILIDDKLPSGRIALYLGSKQWLYANTPPLEPHINRLVDEIKRHLSHLKAREETQASREKTQKEEKDISVKAAEAERERQKPEAKKPPVEEKRGKPKVWLWASIGIIAAAIILGVALKFTVFSTTPDDGQDTIIASANISENSTIAPTPSETTTPPSETTALPSETTTPPTETTPPPETTTAPGEYVAIHYLPTTFDRYEVSGDETFTINLSGNFTCQKDIPYPVNGLVIIPKITARNDSTGNEITLITSNNITSDSVPLKQGETVGFMQSILVQFPEQVAPGNYAIYLEAKNVKVNIGGLWVDIEDLLKLGKQYLGRLEYIQDTLAYNYVKGYVRDAINNAPIVGAAVDVIEIISISTNITLGSIHSTGYSDSSGYYQTELFSESGMYVIRVTADGYITQWYNNVSDEALVTPLSFYTGLGSLTIDFSLDVSP